MYLSNNQIINISEYIMRHKFIDFHCHATLKPYSRSFKKKSDAGIQSTAVNSQRSIWYKEKLTDLKKIVNSLTSITKFTQADFTSAHNGGAHVLMLSIDPMERELILSKKGIEQLNSGKLLKNLVTGIGRPRIDHLFDLKNYFEDLERTRDFLLSLSGKKVTVKGKRLTYKVVDSATAIDFAAADTLYIVVTFEGAHVFRSILGTTDPATITQQVLHNVAKVKDPAWDVKPFFVAPVHHFDYGYCGRAASLTSGSAGKLAYDQKLNPKQKIEPLGLKLIDALLDNKNGRRILIDIKHMNVRSRRHFYQLLGSKYADQNIPIVASHGAMTFTNYPNTDTDEINLYNEEVIKIAESRGIFGVQLDARRLKKGRYGSVRRGVKNGEDKRFLKRSFYVWRQVEASALAVYDKKAKHSDGTLVDPWGFQVIGSDFDGIVDPLDGFWTHEEIPFLRKFLVQQAAFFLKMPRAKALPDYDALDAETIVERFMFLNAKRFLEANL